MTEETALDPPEESNGASESAPATPHVDQRAHTRVNVHWQGAAIINGQPVLGRISDLSRGGLSFMCDTPLAVNAQLIVYLRMPNHDRTGFHQLETVCKVANTVLVASQGCYRMGMRTVELRGNAAPILSQYLAMHGG